MSRNRFCIFCQRARYLALIAILVLLDGFVSPDPLFALTWEKDKLYGDLSGYLEGYVDVPRKEVSPTTDPSAILKVDGTLDIGETFRLQLTPYFSYDGSIKSPKNDNPLESYRLVYPAKAPEIGLDEAYLELIQPGWELKMGIQKVQWGTLDEINPVDNINPQNYGQYMLKQIDRKIGIPMLKLDAYPETWHMRIEGVWVPVLVPVRMSRPGERWFPPIFEVPDTLDLGIPLLPPIAINQYLPEPDLPARTLENSEVALRLSKTLRNVDIAASYYYGFDTKMPVFGAAGWADFRVDGLVPQLSYDVDLFPVFPRVHVWGLELTAAVSQFTFRGEFAYTKGSYHNLGLDMDAIMASVNIPPVEDMIAQTFQNLLATGQPGVRIRMDPEIYLQKDTVRFGVGADYLWGDDLIIAQLMVDHIRDYVPTLFEYEFDVGLMLAMRFTWLDDTLSADIGGIYNFSQTAVMFAPEVSYKILPELTGTLRIVYIDGPFNTIYGQFSNNDQLQIRLRYSF